jgi:hypothetical protein
MIAWKLIAGFAAFCSLSGAGIDRIIQYRHKARLHDAMIRCWVRLSETQARNFIRLLANWVLSRLNRHLGSGFKNFVAAYLIATFIFLWVVYHLQNSVPALLPGGVHGWGHIDTEQPKTFLIKFLFAFRAPHISLVFTAMPFDVLVLFIFLRTLTVIRKCAPVIAALYLFLNLLITGAVAIACIASIFYIETVALNQRWLGMEPPAILLEQAEIRLFNANNPPVLMFTTTATGLFNAMTNSEVALKSGFAFAQGASNAIMTHVALGARTRVTRIHIDNSFADLFRQSFVLALHLLDHKPAPLSRTITVDFAESKTFVHWEHVEVGYVSWPTLLLAGPIATPAMVFVLLLMAMLVARGVLAVVMYFLERATEETVINFCPATLLGVAAGVLIAFINAFGELLKLIGGH